LLRILADENPALRLTLREADQANAEKLLREHEVDLSLALLESKPAVGIESEVLLRVPMVLLIPESAPFRSAAEVLRAHQRNPTPLVSVPAGDRLARLFQEELARRNVDWPARLETSGLDMVACYVANGFGVGLSIAQAQRNLPTGTRALLLKGFPTLVYGALWSKQIPATASRLLELVRERAKQIAAQLPV
jgi:DNA-binding transcriptional LysR family regulator